MACRVCTTPRQPGGNRQTPSVHGTALQQSELPEQIWPYSEHTRPPLPPLPPLPVPPEPEPAPPEPPIPPEPPVPPGPPLQTPDVEPGGRMQIAPGQQSPLMVHGPLRMTQPGPPQRSAP